MTLDDHKVHQKQKVFRGGFALDYLWPLYRIGKNSGTPSNNISKISPKCDLKKCKVDFAPTISHLDDAR